MLKYDPLCLSLDPNVVFYTRRNSPQGFFLELVLGLVDLFPLLVLPCCCGGTCSSIDRLWQLQRILSGGDPDDRIYMWDPVRETKSYGVRAPKRKTLPEFIKV